MGKKKYFVGTVWGCSLDGPYEKCGIGYDDGQIEEYGFVGRGGGEGADFFTTDSLEEALVAACFNPDYINFDGLNEEDKALKDEILKKYEWDDYYGLIKQKDDFACKWYKDDFCTNADSPCVADWCPCTQYPGLCKYYEKENNND